MPNRTYIVKCRKCKIDHYRTSTHSFVCSACKEPDKVYPRAFYYNKKIVIQRDGGRCQCCGTHDHLNVHHLDCNKANNSISNMITLCNQCHHMLHARFTKEELRISNIYNLFPDRFRWGKFGKRAIWTEQEIIYEPPKPRKKVKKFIVKKRRKVSLSQGNF